MNYPKKTVVQAIQFGAIGFGSLLIDVGVTTLAHDMLGLVPFLASALGFLSAFFFNFPLNRKHVFRHEEGHRFSLRTQVILYFALAGFNLLFTSTAVQLLVDGIRIDIALAKIVMTAIIAIWNFLIFKYYIFVRLKHPEQTR